LTERGLWDEDVKNMVVAHNGSIQQIPNIPDDLKKLYRTVWEIPQKMILQMAADRGAFIDQSQSLNVHIADPNYGKLTSMHFHAWKLGLKTGMYYLRTKPAVNAIQFTVNKEKLAAKANGEAKAEANGHAENGEAAKDFNRQAMVCSIQNKDDCLMCGS
jgi:ribonucleoside-diphosphate reductase subunit M1